MAKTWVALLGLLAVLVMAAPVMAQETIAERSAEGITLQDWKDSSLNEKYAFLLGMATMAEMERYWEQTRNENLACKWAQGFDKPTFKQIVDKVDRYAASNPDQMGQDIRVVLWYQMVSPALAAEK